MWLLPEDSSFSSFSDVSVCLPAEDRRIENVLWNPVADGILAVSTNRTVKIYDIGNQAAKFGKSCISNQIEFFYFEKYDK